MENSKLKNFVHRYNPFKIRNHLNKQFRIQSQFLSCFANSARKAQEVAIALKVI